MINNIIEDKQVTPLMRQYLEIKKEYPDVILFFQVGDFYELFFDDAVNTASILGIALTQRGIYQDKPVPLCGVPMHVVEHYLPKLIKAGFKVAICDQVTEPAPGKIIERKVTQVLTPGTLTDDKLLNSKSISYISAIYSGANNYYIIFAELLTGQFFITAINNKDIIILETELAKFQPDEIVISLDFADKNLINFLKTRNFIVSYFNFNNNILENNSFIDWIQNKLDLNFLKEYPESKITCALLYNYLYKNHESYLNNCKNIQVYKSEDYLMLDASTQRNLELVKNNHDNTMQATLFSVLDGAVTPMGSRLIKRWILRPLIKKDIIEQKLDAVGFFVNQAIMRESLQCILKSFGDFERVIGRIALNKANMRDYLQLKQVLGQVPFILDILKSIAINSSLVENIKQKLININIEKLYKLLEDSLNQDNNHDFIIKNNFNAELDNLRFLVLQTGQAILELEHKEQQKTGINSLKIRYSQVHGYAIEITKSNLNLVPDYYTRLQTLVGKERFSISQLKDLEYNINKARSEITFLENNIFDLIKLEVNSSLLILTKLSQAIACLDALLGLAQVCHNNNYTRPIFNLDRNIEIQDGKHPVIAAQLNNLFIPNNTCLNNSQSFWIITGPNMGGKSTYLRQVALICLMAQMGCYVPAKSANLPILDRIFTRIGAGDNLAQGKSTFYIEMEETAIICKQATDKTLVILDEVGRGTSTQDGLAIAQAVAEYINNKIKARCLFATHYHELTDLALNQDYSGIAAYHAATQKSGDNILLLHKILPGVSNNSFGLEVAQLAQLPEEIISRARQISLKLK